MRPLLRRTLPLFLLAALVTTTTGCSVDLVSHEELVEKTFAAKPKPTITVNTYNGAIDVKVEGQALFLAKVHKRGQGSTEEAAKADCDNIEVTIVDDGNNNFRVLAKRTDLSLTNRGGARIELLVPVDATLNLTTSNGAISQNGPSKSVTARSSNGTITAKGGSGLHNLITSNGRVEVEAEQADLYVESSNGKLRFVGSLTEGLHQMKSSNGNIDVQLPSSASFKLDAATSNGKVDCEFSLDNKESKKKSRLAGSVGSNPLAILKLNTSNGSIEVGKKD